MATTFVLILWWRKRYRIISIININKKAVFRELQRRRTILDELDPDIRRIHAKITSVFYHFAQIRKCTEQLFCTSEISNLIEAHSTYNKCCKKIPQNWSISVSTNVLSALPQIKKDLEKLKKKKNFVLDQLIKIFLYKKRQKNQNFSL